MHEYELIKNYFSKLSKSNKSSLDLNDDVFFDKKKGLVVSIDTYNEGIHFLDFKHPYQLIKKVVRSSISDLICKGVLPKFYFISGSGNKKTFTKNNLLKISKSLKHEQKKYKILLCGGDTTFSNRLSFSITSVGYSKKIIFRNKAKINDDIYVTGNLGDSFIGLKALTKKIKLSNKMKNYFIKKYFQPDIQINLVKTLFKYANTSIDISDGLIVDLEKMINKQNLSYILLEKNIPVSRYLLNLINSKKIKKNEIISKGDDYQILFSSNPSKRGIINKTSKIFGIKITRIGKITSGNNKSIIIDQKDEEILIKNKGYIHHF
tara:strand:- start:59 stop:1018 length:960 start_codon:yes stop_codon:yes gene_type:complete